jgi:flagellar biosynthesis/type III secretory pathway ATPase
MEVVAKVRLNIEVSEDLARLLDNLAEDEDVTRTEIVRRALAVLKAYKDQIDVGRTHIGFTRDADKLDLELVGVLTPPIGESRTSESKENVPAK